MHFSTNFVLDENIAKDSKVHFSTNFVLNENIAKDSKRIDIYLSNMNIIVCSYRKIIQWKVGKLIRNAEVETCPFQLVAQRFILIKLQPWPWIEWMKREVGFDDDWSKTLRATYNRSILWNSNLSFLDHSSLPGPVPWHYQGHIGHGNVEGL